MKLGEFLTKMAEKVGKQADEKLISLLSNADLANAEVDDTLASALNTGLMSLDGAKQNQDLLAHYKPIILKGIDEQMAALAKEMGFDTDYAAEPSSYKKLTMCITKTKEAIEAAKKASGSATADAEVKRLTAKLQEMQAAQVAAISAKDAEIKTLKDGFAKDTLNMLITSALSGMNYANEQVDKNVNIAFARSIIDNELTKRKALVINDNGTLKLKQQDAPELDYLDEGHKAVDFSAFIGKSLADSGVLKTTQQPTKTTPPAVTVEQPVEVKGYDEAYQASLNALG